MLSSSGLTLSFPDFDALVKLIESIGEPLFVLVVVILIGLAFVAGWFIGFRKTITEIKQLEAQIVSLEGQILINLQNCRNKSGDESARCGRLALKLHDLIRGGAQPLDLDGAREEFAECLTHHTITAYLHECEWRGKDLNVVNASPDSYTDLLNDAELELRRFRKWLDVVNHPTLLQVLNKKPLVLRVQTLRPFLTLVERFPAAIRNNHTRRARALVDELVAS